LVKIVIERKENHNRIRKRKSGFYNLGKHRLYNADYMLVISIVDSPIRTQKWREVVPL
jgi:hypothetical protein